MTDVDPNARWLQPALDHWTSLRDELASLDSIGDPKSYWGRLDLNEQLGAAEFNLSVMRNAITKGKLLSEAFCALGRSPLDDRPLFCTPEDS